MENVLRRNDITETEKAKLISLLIEELPVLRTKLGLSQDELGNLVGISRQTYSSIETGRRKMSWSMFLSLILIFDYHEQTHPLIHSAGLFPNKIFANRQTTEGPNTISSFMPMENDDIKNHLDERAIHAIETVIMMEYARCNNISGEAVIKAFDGKHLTTVSEKDAQAQRALKKIKSRTVESGMNG